MQISDTYLRERLLDPAAKIGAFLDRYRRASAVDRARMQWAGWGGVVAASIAAGVWLLRGLVGWPGIAVEVTVDAAGALPNRPDLPKP